MIEATFMHVHEIWKEKFWSGHVEEMNARVEKGRFMSQVSPLNSMSCMQTMHTQNHLLELSNRKKI